MANLTMRMVESVRGNGLVIKSQKLQVFLAWRVSGRLLACLILR